MKRWSSPFLCVGQFNQPKFDPNTVFTFSLQKSALQSGSFYDPAHLGPDPKVSQKFHTAFIQEKLSNLQWGPSA